MIQNPAVSQSQEKRAGNSTRIGRFRLIKKFGKRETTNEVKGVVTKNSKKVKWKTKAGILEASDSASVSSMKSP